MRALLVAPDAIGDALETTLGGTFLALHTSTVEQASVVSVGSAHFDISETSYSSITYW